MADNQGGERYSHAMASTHNGIDSADNMGEGLLITFEDGRCAIYPPDLLLSVFSQAKQVPPDEEDELPLTT